MPESGGMMECDGRQYWQPEPATDPLSAGVCQVILCPSRIMIQVFPRRSMINDWPALGSGAAECSRAPSPPPFHLYSRAGRWDSVKLLLH